MTIKNIQYKGKIVTTDFARAKTEFISVGSVERKPQGCLSKGGAAWQKIN